MCHSRQSIFVFIKYYLDNIRRIIFFIFLISIISSVGYLCISNFIVRYMQLDIYRAYKYDRAVTLFSDYSGDKDAAEKTLKNISMLDCVSKVQYADSITSNSFDDNGKNEVFIIYLPRDLAFNPWKVVAGRMPSPDAKNEICLSSNFMPYYEVGDTINVNLFWGDSYVNGETDNCILEITGFFDVNSYMPNNKGSFNYEISTWSELPVGYAFTYDIYTEDNVLTIPNPDYSQLIIYPEDGYSMEEVKEKACIVTGLSTAYTYSDYKEYCYQKNKTNNAAINLFFGANFIISIAVMCSYTIIQLSINRKQLLIYYLNGCTWKKSVGIACFAYFPILLIGIIIGIIIYSCLPLFKQMTNGTYIWGVIPFAIVSTALVTSFLIFNSFFYFYTIRRSPMDMIREE